MQLQTILNRVQKHSSFVYKTVRFVEQDGLPALEIDIVPRANGRAQCSGCGRRAPGYDHLRPRRFEFVPLWGLLVFFVYEMRRVNCQRCGIIVERVPWADGKETLTKTYAWFLARWAKRLSWKEVADTFHSSWDTVFRAVKMAVAWGRAHQDLGGIRAIGVDEIARQKGQKYLTLVYQIDEGCRRLLWVGRDRTEKTLEGFFTWFGEERSQLLAFVASDMWKPYLKVIRMRAAKALNILDRFHIMGHISKAIDEVRAHEARKLKAQGRDVLRHSRWVLLKRPENLTQAQEIKLSELLKCNLQVVKCYLLKESFQVFWTYVSPYYAYLYLNWWCSTVMRTKIEPMKKVARMLRAHEPLILNWFRAKGTISSAAVEGLNNKAKLTARKAYGYRSAEVQEIALYHALGKLPEPEDTHRFC